MTYGVALAQVWLQKGIAKEKYNRTKKTKNLKVDISFFYEG